MYNNTTDLHRAIDSVADMVRGAGSPPHHFPPTELFNEGWMLRLLMQAHAQGHGGLPEPRFDDTRWFSEARLASAFRPRFRGDRLAEGFTHVDAALGHIGFREDTSAGLRLEAGARQFVIVEAKMGSPLSAGTSNAPQFDQAARNVAAMAWALHGHITGTGHQLPESLAFLVIAPACKIEDPAFGFASCMTKKLITRKITERVRLYGDDDTGRAENLRDFEARA